MQKLYSSREASEEFTKRQDNPTHHALSRIISATIDKFKNEHHSIVNLSGRGNPQFFKEIFDQFTDITWLTPSPIMQDIAQANLGSTNITEFAIGSPESYLQTQPDKSIQLAFMKHTFSETQNIQEFFEEIRNKLSEGGHFIANISGRKHLKRHSRNASYFVEDQLVPEEGIQLENGQSFTVKFLAEYNEPESGYIPNAELTFFYYEPEHIIEVAKSFGLDIEYYGPHQGLIITDNDHEIETNLLVLTKKN